MRVLHLLESVVWMRESKQSEESDGGEREERGNGDGNGFPYARGERLTRLDFFLLIYLSPD